MTARASRGPRRGELLDAGRDLDAVITGPETRAIRIGDLLPRFLDDLADGSGYTGPRSWRLWPAELPAFSGPVDSADVIEPARPVDDQDCRP